MRSDNPPFEGPLDILYQDEYLVAINKPSGLLVHRSMIDRHETQFAVQMLRDQIGCHVYPAHRLDRATSGVLLFALQPETAKDLYKQFELQLVDKTYLAVVRGHPPVEGTIDYALSRQVDDNEFHDERAELLPQPAITHFKTLATITLPVMIDKYPTSRYALVRLKPETGRRHQIRRHLKHIAHPIIGDANHGKGVHNRYFKQHFQCGRLLLACTELSLTHPITQQKVMIQAPINGEFLQLTQQFEWQCHLAHS
ncbi:tRNA pseudouridine(65) synthase TruC [Leeia sp. TBRC 13508]|uniref:tRNA pseudouridine synthase C n=1 Tax=Leeia speluncae TaxID=2884804 RepID=A0ABS8D196_9NEIS|nr:tRNA pseudouridine(65) synthase TruC [Leeia speluncae]MCB6181960.1 tRNA pseudouridine(65) synthase TruC [Leeia speluncae]